MFIIVASNTFFQSYAGSDLFGKSIFIALFVLSIVSWIILINKMWMTRVVRKASQDIQNTFEGNQRSPLNVELAARSIKEMPNPFYEMYYVMKRYTVDVLNKNKWFCEQKHGSSDAYLSVSDIELLESHLSVSITNQVRKLEKNLFILPTVVTLAPFLGLLGTVWGILLTFSELQMSGLATSNQVVLSGLSMALATTVLGLVVAIPALIAYNYLKNSIRHYETEMEHFSHMMLASIELQYRKVDVE